MRLGKKIKALREQHNLTQDYVANKVGISQPQISLIEKGEILPTTFVLKLLANLFNVDYNKLRDLKEEDEIELEARKRARKAKAIEPSHRIPILNEIPADIPSNFTDYEFPPGIAEDYVDNHLKNFITTDPSTYALRVGGDCMEPELKKGDIVVLSTTKEWQSGDIVAVKWDEGEKKELRKIIKQNDHIILQPENPKYTPIVLNSDHQPQIMGVVTMIIRIKK